MSQFQAFGATNLPGTCLWCGRQLRRKAYATKAAIDRAPSDVVRCGYEDCRKKFKWREAVVYNDGTAHCPGCDSYVDAQKRRVVSRELVYTKPGDYGDGHFCGLRCGYRFGVAVAGHGRRLEPAKEKK